MRRFLLAVGAVLTATLGSAADNWPAWRGAAGTGLCHERDLPVQWSATENIRWKVKLPGPGNSVPAVWGERIFVTQALDKKGNKRALLCFQRKDGTLLWQKVVEYPEKESTHADNPYCSASPATDGERVIVSHGSAGLFCYDFQGKELWRRDLGKFEHIWGNAASPVIYEDLVILNCGPGERTFLIALDKRTGEDVWRVRQLGGKFGEKNTEWIGSWSTPVVVKTSPANPPLRAGEGGKTSPPNPPLRAGEGGQGGEVNSRDELIMSWPEAVKAYDPRTGELLWTCKGLGKLVYTSPLVTPEVVVAMSGYGGPYLALRPAGQGDVTGTHRLWHLADRPPQRVGSGVIVGEHVYILNENSTVQCIEWRTGKTLWAEKVGGRSWGSMVHAGDKLYVTNQEAETFVIAAKPTFELISRNPLKERSQASPAISDGEIFLRTYEHLWCVSARASEVDEAATIKKFVLDAQQAGFVRHDLETYLAQWADDARIVGARGEAPGKHELTLVRKQIDATRRLRFRGKPEIRSMSFASPRVTVEGDEAILRVLHTVEFEGGFESVSEIYRLRRTANGWKVYENRWWPVRAKYGERKFDFNEGTWKELDARVEECRRKGDLRELLRALFDAFRFAEAHETARKLTGGADVEALDWVMRGQAAVLAGDGKDAAQAFQKALELDPRAPVPSYARPADK